ncbi:MAG: amidase, partial [Panacagrimonas sp.]
RGDEPREALPPLLGVPCSIKENFAFTGFPQVSGMIARRHAIAQADAPTVARLRAAGAIVLGFTNTPELCMWMETNNRVYGRTRNPYDARRIAGGSSGGEGSLIGAGASPFGLGADVGGSIRFPAFFNGVFGHKPTPGIVPNTGQFPLPEGLMNHHCVTGPIARRAEDLWPLLKILAGPDGVDPLCRPKALNGSPSKINLEQLRAFAIRDDGRRAVAPDMMSAQRRAAEVLGAQTQGLTWLELPRLRHAFEIWSALMHEAKPEAFARQLGQGRRISVLRELAKWPLGLTPHTLPALALAALDALPLPTQRFVKLGAELREELIDTLGDNGVLLYPPYTRVAPRHNRPLLRPFDFAYCGIFNVLGFPSTQVPLGLNADGLPLGVQVVGAPGQDARTIAVALQLEQAFGGWTPPPDLLID